LNYYGRLTVFVKGRPSYSVLPVTGALGGVGFLATAIGVVVLQRFLRSKCRDKRLSTADGQFYWSLRL